MITDRTIIVNCNNRKYALLRLVVMSGMFEPVHEHLVHTLKKQ